MEGRKGIKKNEEEKKERKRKHEKETKINEFRVPAHAFWCINFFFKTW